MKYRIKCLHDAAIRSLKADYAKYDTDSRRNDLIMTRLFDDTKAGKINGFFYVSDDTFKAYHRSTKKAGFIQLSCGFYRDGELIPCSDSQLETAAEMIKEGYSSGFYQIIE